MKTEIRSFRKWRQPSGMQLPEGSYVGLLMPDDDQDVLQQETLRQLIAAEVQPQLHCCGELELIYNLKAFLSYEGDGLFRFDPRGSWGGPSRRRQPALRLGLSAFFAEDGFDVNTAPEYSFLVLWLRGGVACDDDPIALAEEIFEITGVFFGESRRAAVNVGAGRTWMVSR